MFGRANPPIWDEETLKTDRLNAISNFIAERNAFGTQAITVAVLAGVYELHNLLAAQHRPMSVAIFWEHRLNVLADFVKLAK